MAMLALVLQSSGVYAGALDSRLPRPLDDSDFHEYSDAGARLGRLLFYDPILSGNLNISCATCHHHKHASADGLSLPIGEGGVGLGPLRTIGVGNSQIKKRVPRNSQALFNIGAKQYQNLFFDGRVALDPTAPGGFNTPADEDLPAGLGNVLAAQALFPVTSEIEMAGEFGENEIANAANRAHEYVWPLLAKRLRAIAEYVELFKNAYPEIRRASDITMVHVANAIADFEVSEWRADQSPFDRYLRGESAALTQSQHCGMDLFYGDAGCAGCHSGTLQTDHKYHAIAMPQLGWIRTRLFDTTVRDQGRVNESDKFADRYRFRTPSLRNVEVTAPYGHSGAFATLEAVVRHHLDPADSFKNYDRNQARLPPHPVQSKLDFLVMENEREVRLLLASNELAPGNLTDSEIDCLLDFLKALTDEKSLAGRLGPPASVPSGLKID